MRRLAIFISHPIQYQAPLYQRLNQELGISLMVCFYCRQGAEKRLDPQFGQEFKWDIPLLEDYAYKFLKNYSPVPGFHFFGFVNLGILKEIFQNKFDAVLVNNWSYLSDWLVFLSAWLTRTPILLRTENPFSQELLKAEWKRAIKKIILGKILFPRIHAFLYIGAENKKFYQYYGVPEEKLFFTPYAVDNSRFIDEARIIKSQISNLKSQNENVECKNSLGIDPNKIAILFAGKLIAKKRPMDLLMAYRDLVDQLSTTNYQLPALLFVGDGILRSKLEGDVAENKVPNVHFVGFKNQTEITKYYALADILVLLSGAGETWGLAVNEAMCFGLPIIVSNLVGCGPDLVKQGENGYIYPVGDIKQLVRYLENLVTNPEKRRKFGEKSLEIIKEYSFEQDIEGIKKSLDLAAK